MKIMLSNQAEDTIKQRLGQQPGVVRLVYDTEGCGCAVSGVPGLWITDKNEPNDMKMDSSAIPFWMDRRQAVFFDEDLQLDIQSGPQSFRLHSDSQFYGLNIKLIDKRG
ncbi:iron-sulfur cluster biosynthesis family protein [Paenibacillus sediminis]|uniref:Uncharacterized protein YqkB n=1 Tax=Paenibacillus sediminis TaxID=664909 RepID=A0ABS4H013_9BACL|nr:iron-sulfur cluster biosynthesis family protein [Paenibacillus sediminis]MBP1935866.1 uncharacterized protein YqkB [Paenibacillus sediminis]